MDSVIQPSYSWARKDGETGLSELNPSKRMPQEYIRFPNMMLLYDSPEFTEATSEQKNMKEDNLIDITFCGRKKNIRDHPLCTKPQQLQK